MRWVIARKPDFVHPVIQGDDVEVAHHGAHVAHYPLGQHWKAVGVATDPRFFGHFRLDLFKERQVEIDFSQQFFSQLGNG